MAPQTAAETLAELLARLSAVPGGSVLVAADELARWPAEAVQALRDARALVPAGPAASAVCPGCEQACVMPVEVLGGAGPAVRAFIACDKREDIGRVPVALAALERWRCSADTLADALARGLSGAAAVRLAGEPATWRLGLVAGRQGRAVAVMRAGAAGAAVVELAGHRLDVATLLSVQAATLVLDRQCLARCADSPVEGTGAGETPEQRRERLRVRVAAVKAAGVRGFLKAVAAEEGMSDSRLKQLLAGSKPVAATWAAALMPAQPSGRASSKKTARKR